VEDRETEISRGAKTRLGCVAKCEEKRMKFMNASPKNVLGNRIKAVGETPANTTRATSAYINYVTEKGCVPFS
jgi:hypothetical protein